MSYIKGSQIRIPYSIHQKVQKLNEWKVCAASEWCSVLQTKAAAARKASPCYA